MNSIGKIQGGNEKTQVKIVRTEEKTQNSRKKLKTQEKNSNFWHIHMLAKAKRCPN